MPWFSPLQARAVDALKAHALGLSLRSPRAHRSVLTEYLHVEEGAEAMALAGALTESARQAGHDWVERLLARQLADEARHAALLRQRLAALTPAGEPIGGPPRGLARLAWIKLRGFEAVCRRYDPRFAAGRVVVALAAAAQAEATGVRVFVRHLAVLEAHERRTATIDPTAVVLRSILADERRHARSCAAAALRLTDDAERPQLEALRRELAAVDRSFGVTIAAGYWLMAAGRAALDRLAPEPFAAHPMPEAA